MSDVETNLTLLLHQLRDVFDGSDVEAVRDILKGWPAQPRSITAPSARRLPVTQWLPEARKHTPKGMGAVVQTLSDVSATLCWQQTYSDADMDQYFLNRYGWTMLVGPDAPLASDKLLCGFLLLGQGVEYPPHQHAAEEVYVVLSGTASWKLEDDPWQTLVPGTVVHNPPWRIHGMRTDQNQPLLLAFLWQAARPEKSRVLG